MLSRSRSETCVSDLLLDELLVGELTLSEERAAHAHLDACGVCSRRLQVLQEGRDPLPALPSRRARRWPSAARVALGGAVAAALAFFVVHVPGATISSTRTKGGPRLGYFVKHGADTHPGGAGEPVRAGDTLIFAATSPTPAFVAVFSHEGPGKASVYFPSGSRAEEVAAGRDVLLPLATVLDDTIGTEQLYGLFCSSAQPIEPLRSALASTGALPVPQGCRVDTLTLSKVR
jgi:hypothetical protein